MTAPPPSATDMAMVRTELAHERTLMAWVRTSFSMISFGFTFFKFFQYLGQSNEFDAQRQMTSARNLGVTMILLGTCSLIGAIVQHRRALEEMKAQGYAVGMSLSFVVAVTVTVVGLLAFLGAFIRTGIF